MKVRDSGMPEEEYWESLFDVPRILEWLELSRVRDVAELGCGYGTFTVPMARAVTGTVWTFDVDEAMLARTRSRGAGLRIVCERRDVMEHGFGVRADAVLLFNILHCDEPATMLRHAAAALSNSGRVFAIHWRHGPTPRGPRLDIRPRPEQMAAWARDAGLAPVGGVVDLPPWHYGIKFTRAADSDASPDCQR
jgi:SAM-dependent methyltransferase